MPAKTTKTTAGAAPAADLETTSAADLNDASLDGDTKALLSDAARRAERIVQDGLETLRAQSRVYVDAASQQLDTAQRYVVERVKERPVTATMAGVGVGLLLGLLIAGGRNNHRAPH